MANIMIRTELFSTELEGDLESCNGMPGSALAGRLRSVLVKHGYQCDEPIQEDYGWHMWLPHSGLQFAVTTSLCGSPGEVDGIPEWMISITHEISIINPAQWLKRKEGKNEAYRIFEILRDEISSDKNITIIEEKAS